MKKNFFGKKGNKGENLFECSFYIYVVVVVAVIVVVKNDPTSKVYNFGTLFSVSQSYKRNLV